MGCRRADAMVCNMDVRACEGPGVDFLGLHIDYGSQKGQLKGTALLATATVLHDFMPTLRADHPVHVLRRGGGARRRC